MEKGPKNESLLVGCNKVLLRQMMDLFLIELCYHVSKNVKYYAEQCIIVLNWIHLGKIFDMFIIL